MNVLRGKAEKEFFSGEASNRCITEGKTNDFQCREKHPQETESTLAINVLYL